MTRRVIKLMFLAAATLAADGAWANNLTLTNLTIKPRDDSTAYVKFDIQWENSWRYTNINHDAAWVFFKVKPEGRTDWKHVTLETNGHVTGTGTPIDIIVPNDRVGCFIRRDAEGTGTLSVTNVKVAWNFVSNNLVMTDRVRLQAFAVEMVHVAEGAFWVGNTNGVIDSSFRAAGDSNSPIYIASTNEFTIYWGTGPTSATISNSFPNGYAAFYCMKYEITQGQYRDFLNSLTRAQQNTRTATQNPDDFAMTAAATIGTARNGIRCPSSVPSAPDTIIFGCDGNNNKVFNQTNDAMDRACNWISWGDMVAFADWSGLRPMTELEFEKACRGPLEAVANEYAWGDITVTSQTGVTGADGSGTETASPADANYRAYTDGPMRVGIYATAGSTRQAAGASYWGIMDLSGNVTERIVTVGNATGRSFTGLHGDGQLNESGDADVSQWPGTGALGSGGRGYRYFATGSSPLVANRKGAATALAVRHTSDGGRAVRTAPSGVLP